MDFAIKQHSLIPSYITEYCELHTSDEPMIAGSILNSSKYLSNSHMLVGKIIGNLLKIIVSLSNPRRVLEIGTYTGYSSAMMASALSEKSKLITLEEDSKIFEIAKNNLQVFIERGVVEVINEEGMDWLSRYNEHQFEALMDFPW